MEIGLWIVQCSLLGIYGAYGVYKTFWTDSAREKMAWTQKFPFPLLQHSSTPKEYL